MRILLSLLFLSLFVSCKDSSSPTITVSNSLDIKRVNETVTVSLKQLGFENMEGLYQVKDSKGSELLSQLEDSDGDEIFDAIIFQPEIPANGSNTFHVISVPGAQEPPLERCYSRFVPERTDDYAWENNRVAFRTYGPTAQKMKEDGVKGGTLSSGIDAWLKRVEYPIINKWYKKELETDGSYHKDTGEGLDNFHVGESRGVGGTARRVDADYAFSKNYTSWKTLSNGPIRTSFVLTYATWDAAGSPITEEKTISLDYGSNLSKFEIDITGSDTISTGLTLHDKKGESTVNQESGWLSYWEPHEDSELGTGLVIPANQMVGYEEYVTDKKDRSNLFAHLEVNNKQVTYYAGFAWKKSGQFNTKEEWNAYLEHFSKCLSSPLSVDVK